MADCIIHGPGGVTTKKETRAQKKARDAVLGAGVVSVDAVKAEAERRILDVIPEWKQRNLLAQAVNLTNKGKVNWTQEEMDAWAAGEAVWATVQGIRDASDIIEKMDPIPADYRDNKHWPD